MSSLLVGSYAAKGCDGLHLYSFDQDNVAFTLVDSIALASPSYLTIEPGTNLFYAVNELKDEQACLVALRLEDNCRRLKVLNSCLTSGASPCHVSRHNDLVVTANYRGGSLSLFRVGQTGAILSLLSVIKGTTGGPDLSRQNVPHIHCALFSPDGKYLFATDFSADRIIRLEIEQDGVGDDTKSWPLSYLGGYGPRHLLFSPDGRFLYVIGELSDCITVFEYHEGDLTEVQTIVADEDHGRGGAHLLFSPDGSFLYSSHRRKNDKIVVFLVDKPSGILTRIGSQPTMRHPRQFCLTHSGDYLLVVCMDDNAVQVFRRNPSTGLLAPANKLLMVESPAFVLAVNNTRWAARH